MSASYQLGGVHYRRDVYASHPDDVVIVRLTQSGGGSYTGSVALTGTHGETTAAGAFGGTLPNGLAYGAVVAVAASGGAVANGSFTGCREVLIVICGGTNYVPDPATAYLDPAVDPTARARAKAIAAAACPPTSCWPRTSPTTTRCTAAWTSTSAGRRRRSGRWTPRPGWPRVPRGGTPDPELEAGYLQFGRYLMISGSRTSVPLNLQGLWLDSNTPAWMADYHTDINVQMNYWLAGRAGLGDCFTSYADYVLSQLPCWTEQTRRLFLDPNNWFHNSSRQGGRLDHRDLDEPVRRHGLVVAPGRQRVAVQLRCTSTTGTQRTPDIFARYTIC